MPKRRTFLKVLGSAAGAFAASPLLEAFADPDTASTEFFLFIHQAGGWDVTLWSDPRNETQGLVNPATTDSCDVTGLTQWVDQPLGDSDTTFKLVQPAGSNIVFGPAIGDLATHYDRILLVNGISMNTVSHPDGTYFSSTGRHLAGGRPVASSIDTMIANELGKEQLFPTISVNFPSTFLGVGLDSRVQPLRVGSIATVGKSLTRSNSYEDQTDRDALSVVLTEEATELATQSFDPTIMNAEALQLGSLKKMIASNLLEVFTTSKLQMLHPEFNYKGKYQGGQVVNAAFAVEAMSRNIVRCLSFAMSSCDTHNTNYKNHPMILQETFDMIALLLQKLDTTPHPTLSGEMLSAHTHIMVISDFCRTPQINQAGGRDHYPNNTSMIISPKFKANMVYGKSDPEQLLPLDSGVFSDGSRPITPPDVLSTFVGAFGGDPKKYLRDGEVVKDLLK